MPVNPLPEMVTRVPPNADPVPGVIEVIVGAGGAVTVKPAVEVTEFQGVESSRSKLPTVEEFVLNKICVSEITQ